VEPDVASDVEPDVASDVEPDVASDVASGPAGIPRSWADQPDDQGDEIPRSASLSPTERVIPSWTDPTVRRASEVIGGPLGRHAQVGRAAILTPLRVALLMAIFVLIGGWLFKAPCIQTGANGQLDQSGQRPWITGCYNDVVPLFGGRGLDDPHRNPYAYSWAERPDGSTSRIWPADQVTVSDGQVVGTENGTCPTRPWWAAPRADSPRSRTGPWSRSTTPRSAPSATWNIRS
jgi:hypothetical protein